MTELHLFRHGQTQWNVEKRLQGHMNSDLTELGIQQAIDARQKLNGYNFDVVYSSPSGRAIETTKLLTADLNLPINEDAGLMEIKIGPWEGLTYEETVEKYPVQREHHSSSPAKFKLEGAETFLQVMERAQVTLSKIAKAHQGQRILIVTHGVFIKAAITMVQQRSVDTLWDGPESGNLSRSIVKADKDFELSSTFYCDEVWPK